MKFVVSLFVIALITAGVYVYIKNHRVIVAGSVALLLLGILACLMYRSATSPDTQCGSVHTTTSRPPASLQTADDYFQQGNYDYDTGNCGRAIIDYTISIGMNPEYPQTYNNRAYTYMRMRDYTDALPDLDKAIALNPNYIQALMNRGDIHNYYFAIDRKEAAEDYERVIVLGGTQVTSVCGHLFLAEHNGWNFGTILDVPRVVFHMCH
jgi:Flp pilus assembly protein TadD